MPAFFVANSEIRVQRTPAWWKMAPKLRLGKKSDAATESHVERMARLSLQKANDSLPEMDRLLNTLPKAVKQFVDAYSGLSSEELLLKAPASLEPAKTLRQVAWHFRDLSWRTSLKPEQASMLCKVFADPLHLIQVLVTLVGGLDLQGLLGKGVSSAALLGAFLLGLEVSTLYCVLASSFGVPVTLVVEEVSLGIVRCLKESLRQIIAPMLSPDGERSRKATAHDTGVDLPFSAEEGTTLCTCVADLMQVSSGDLLLLGREARNSWDLFDSGEFLSRAPRLPSGKKAKKFQLPATEDSAAYGLSTWTHLLLRLCQSSCLPLREPIGANVDFDNLLSQRPASQSVVSQLMAGLLQRLVLSRSKDEEARAILEDFAEELLHVAFKPMWPAAVALLRLLLQQLIGLLQEKKQAGDITVREFALKLLRRRRV
ncbi:unnamed protein product [Effrenium voratum]|nr:unnamed protein product [Effrenium voratum]